MPKDQDILAQVNKLVAEEQELRNKLQHHEIDESEEHQRLRAVEVELDGQSMGYAGKGAQLAEALSLDPQSIVDRSNKGGSAQ